MFSIMLCKFVDTAGLVFNKPLEVLDPVMAIEKSKVVGCQLLHYQL